MCYTSVCLNTSKGNARILHVGGYPTKYCSICSLLTHNDERTKYEELATCNQERHINERSAMQNGTLFCVI